MKTIDSKLIKAVFEGDNQKIKDLIVEGADVNCQDSQNLNYREFTPLMYAVEKADLEMVKFFLSVDNIDINIQNTWGHTALIKSRIHHNWEIYDLIKEFSNIKKCEITKLKEGIEKLNL